MRLTVPPMRQLGGVHFQAKRKLERDNGAKA